MIQVEGFRVERIQSMRKILLVLILVVGADFFVLNKYALAQGGVS
jgi:hypothetical protein